MPRGTYFFRKPPAWQKVPNSNPSAMKKLRCIADERRSTGVWNEGWCKVGGITQRVLWMLKAWLSSSKGGADAAPCASSNKKNPFRLSFFTKNHVQPRQQFRIQALAMFDSAKQVSKWWQVLTRDPLRQTWIMVVKYMENMMSSMNFHNSRTPKSVEFRFFLVLIHNTNFVKPLAKALPQPPHALKGLNSSLISWLRRMPGRAEQAPDLATKSNDFSTFRSCPKQW